MMLISLINVCANIYVIIIIIIIIIIIVKLAQYHICWYPDSLSFRDIISYHMHGIDHVK